MVLTHRDGEEHAEVGGPLPGELQNLALHGQLQLGGLHGAGTDAELLQFLTATAGGHSGEGQVRPNTGIAGAGIDTAVTRRSTSRSPTWKTSK